MADLVTTGSKEEISALKQKIRYNESQLAKEGFKVKFQIKEKGQLAMLKCNYYNFLSCENQFEENSLYFKQYIANIISELIISHWEGKLVKEFIKDEYYFFTPEEKEKIFIRSLELIQIGYPHECESIIYKLNRTTKIIKCLADYLTANNLLNIEGFIKFRLKDYTFELKEAVNYAVDEFMMEKEYREFIRLLRYFVEIQEPRLEKVHLLVKNKGEYMLFDNDKKEISSEYLDEFFTDLIDSDINFEDLLISALITIAPKEIIIHSSVKAGREETLQTIEQVFNDRLTKCNSCDWCNSFQLQ